ncbi:hypothetical protein [Xylella fastidiosa]|uniref:hypothetical protein n=1 Tax=Xylella fastidiosa TaxID=2371 RepID=UPI00398562D3
MAGYKVQQQSQQQRTSHAVPATESRRRVGQRVAVHGQRAPEQRQHFYDTFIAPQSRLSAFNCQTNTTRLLDQTAKAHLATLQAGPSAQPYTLALGASARQ